MLLGLETMVMMCVWNGEGPVISKSEGKSKRKGTVKRKISSFKDWTLHLCGSPPVSVFDLWPADSVIKDSDLQQVSLQG